MQKWTLISLGIWNTAWKQSITLGCRVVGSEPMPRAWAASIRFWQAGITELAPPPGAVSAKATHGTSFMSSDSPIAERWFLSVSGMSSDFVHLWSSQRLAHHASL